MKKLLSLVLVLALCSISSAVVINITDAEGNSEITGLVDSDYVELLIWYDGDTGCISSFDMEIGSDNHEAGTLGTPTITATGRLPGLDYVGPGFSEGMDWELSASTQTPPLGAGILTPLATVMFHCEGEGDVIISGLDVATLDNDFAQIVPTINGMIIHQVPEPATIALLCLGGLLLRKR